MKIALNVSQSINTHTGIGVYTRNLLRSLTNATNSDEIIPLSHPAIDNSPAKPLLSKRFPRIIWEHFSLPEQISKAKVDLFHNPDYSLPLRDLSCPSVITVHDLSFLLYPEFFPPITRSYKKNILTRTIPKAVGIITDSENTRRDLLGAFNLPPEKIEVIYPGIDPAFKVIKDPSISDQVKTKYNLPERFILCVGMIEPRKNLLRLLSAFSRCPIKTWLVIAGGKGWRHRQVFEAVNNNGIRKRTLFFGNLPTKDLAVFYNLAEFVIYPSLYEGFGFPPLEAMACGTPVIVSNVSSIPEVVGEAGIFFDPHNADDLLDKITCLLDDETLRRSLKEKGLKRARFFSWEKTARKILDFYRSLSL